MLSVLSRGAGAVESYPHASPKSGTKKNLRFKRVKYTDGSVYEGRVDAEGKREGRGTLRGADGSVYEGQWAGDLRQGFGWLIAASGMEYTGEFHADRADGQGSARYPSGDLYRGGWKEGVRCGHGKMVFQGSAPGQVYEGGWEADVPHGEGTFTEINDAVPGRLDRYEGGFHRGMKQGYGMLRTRLVEGSGGTVSAVYVGEFLGGVRHGRGCLEVERTWRYEGQWRDNVREGKGKCEYADGSVYEGEWANDVWDGKGKATSSEQARGVCGDAVPVEYEGSFKDGREEGKGIAKYGDGSVYTGDFLGGLRHGSGTLRGMPGGRVYEGEWKEGQKSGQGRESDGDKGWVYVGMFLDGVRHGNGVLWDANSGDALFRGRWEHGSESQRGGCEPKKSLVAGPGIHGARSGVPVTFTILARDELGNKRLEGRDDTFHVSLVKLSSGEETQVNPDVEISVSKVRQATYQVTYTPKEAGVYKLHVYLAKGEPLAELVDVAQSPYAIDVTPGAPDPRQFHVSGPGLAGAPDVSAQEEPPLVLVRLHDANGNPCEEESASACASRLKCFASLEGDAKSAVHWPVSDPRDERTCSLQAVHPVDQPPLAPGLWRLSVTWDGRDIAGSPFSLSVRGTSEASSQIQKGDVPLAVAKDWEAVAVGQLLVSPDYDSANDSELEEETQRERNLRVNPDIPVLESAADMHKVRPAKRTKAERAEMRRRNRAFEEYMGELVALRNRQRQESQQATEDGTLGMGDRHDGVSTDAADFE